MEYRAEKEIAVSAEKIFTIISDVNEYQHFLPWCQGSRIVTQINEQHAIGELLIGFQHFQEKLASEVILDMAHMRVEMRAPIADNFKQHYQASHSNAVKKLHAFWQLKSVAGSSGERSMVEFYIDFTMKSVIHNQMLKLLMRDAIEKMTDAFVLRAQQ